MTLATQDLDADADDARERDRQTRMSSAARLEQKVEREMNEDPDKLHQRAQAPGCIITRGTAPIPERPPGSDVKNARMIATNLEGAELTELMNDLGWTRYKTRRIRRSDDQDAGE